MRTHIFIKKIDNEKNKELVRFLLAGGGAVIADLLAYILIVKFLDYNLAKGISFGLGSLVAYFLNNFWTFKAASVNHINLVRFTTLYLSTFVFNVTTNNLVFVLLEDKWIAFFFATCFSAIINYVGQKIWVFRK